MRSEYKKKYNEDLLQKVLIYSNKKQMNISNYNKKLKNKYKYKKIKNVNCRRGIYPVSNTHI